MFSFKTDTCQKTVLAKIRAEQQPIYPHQKSVARTAIVSEIRKCAELGQVFINCSFDMQITEYLH